MGDCEWMLCRNPKLSGFLPWETPPCSIGGGICAGIKMLLSEWRPAVANRNNIWAAFGVPRSLVGLLVVILDTFLKKHRSEKSKRFPACCPSSQPMSGSAPLLLLWAPRRARPSSAPPHSTMDICFLSARSVPGHASARDRTSSQGHGCLLQASGLTPSVQAKAKFLHTCRSSSQTGLS